MSDIKISKGRGRPRAFDPDVALEKAQALFHARGYDGVSMADLTAALGINPPSFYAAFGSKAALFGKVLARYERCDGLPVQQVLRDDLPVARGLAALLSLGAETYARDASRPGCMVMEASRDTSNPAVGPVARTLRATTRNYIRDFIAARHAARADIATDYVMTTMAGLSSAAREGMDGERLRQVAQIAGTALPLYLDG